MNPAGLSQPGSSVLTHLPSQLDAGEDAAGRRRAVDVAGIPVRALVKILLVGIQEILYSGIDLKDSPFGNAEVMARLEIEINEAWRALGAVLRDVAGMMFHQHPDPGLLRNSCPSKCPAGTRTRSGAGFPQAQTSRNSGLRY